ncbi:MAG: hypothetical protein ACT4OG_06790 [Alphaproteobacteria bacterium]
MMASKKAWMQPFTMVARSLWYSEKFEALPDDGTRYLYVYLLTCPHQTSCGCFVLHEAYVLDDLNKTGSEWTRDKLRNALEAITKRGLALYDAKTGEILLTTWWKNYPPNNPSWREGAERQCESIQSDLLRDAALRELQNRCAARSKPPIPDTPTAGLKDERLIALRRRLAGTA